MDKFKIINSYYVEPESFPVQGTWAKVKSYQNKGYIVKKEGKGNGNWLIIALAKAMFDVMDGDIIKQIDLAQAIKVFYRSNKMTMQLFNTFVKAEKDGVVGVYFSRSHGYYIASVTAE